MARKRGGFVDAGGARFDIVAEALAKRGLAVSPAEPPRLERPPQAPTAVGGIALTRCGKITLQREKKGRGGKTVTIISGLGLPARQLEQLARTLRKALGCGSMVEDGDIVVQGDMTTRVAVWLRIQGAERIVIGN